MGLLTKIWPCREGAQGQEVFELASAMEEIEGTRPTDGRADKERAVNEKTGNEEDQMHMRRLGKPQVLKVGHQYQRLSFAMF